eukprot:UN11174
MGYGQWCIMIYNFAHTHFFIIRNYHHNYNYRFNLQCI